MPDSSNDEFLDAFEPEPETPEHQYHQLMQVMPFFHGVRPIGLDELFTEDMFVCTFFIRKATGNNGYKKLAKLERFKAFNDSLLNTCNHWLAGQTGSLWVGPMDLFADSKSYFFPYVSIQDHPPAINDASPPINFLMDEHPFASNYLALENFNQGKVSAGPREPSIGNINFSKPSPLP